MIRLLFVFVGEHFRKGTDDTVVCFAFGVVYGNEDATSLPSYTNIQSQLDSNRRIVAVASVDDVSSESW